MSYGVQSPSKYTSLERLEQIKRDNYVAASGKEYSDIEVDDMIWEKKMSKAQELVDAAEDYFWQNAELKEEEIAALASNEMIVIGNKEASAIIHVGFSVETFSNAKPKSGTGNFRFHFNRLEAYLYALDHINSVKKIKDKKAKDPYHSLYAWPEGICPRCKEHTQAGNSCCGQGAIVEGDLLRDEDAAEYMTDRTNVEQGGAR